MTSFTAWLPIILCVLPLGLYVLALYLKKIRPKNRPAAFGYGLLVLATSFLVVSLLWWFFFVKAKPDDNWKEIASKTDTAILMGFGYVLDEDGVMFPGKANKALYKKAVVRPVGLDTLHLIMQEGVMVAALKDKRKYPFKRNLIRMHPHDDSTYINTLIAANYALLKMESLGVKTAVIYAHDLQLARAVYDLKRIAASDPRWKDMVFITPYIRPTPVTPDSEQWYTRSTLIFFLREIFLARPYETIYQLRRIAI